MKNSNDNWQRPTATSNKCRACSTRAPWLSTNSRKPSSKSLNRQPSSKVRTKPFGPPPTSSPRLSTGDDRSSSSAHLSPMMEPPEPSRDF
ncbi:hypothetical protein CKAH01_13338 [Colletotrichum kahawae]|uniref:Uncharacterized protein n=1 Tax=Colletotrichum kahawae TaxID=34407 RepID=A0AAD9YNF8_COLKA|nr:hypothetical protein CKAH01_13338 [Colletotrichum kahawae]